MTDNNTVTITTEEKPANWKCGLIHEPEPIQLERPKKQVKKEEVEND